MIFSPRENKDYFIQHTPNHLILHVAQNRALNNLPSYYVGVNNTIESHSSYNFITLSWTNMIYTCIKDTYIYTYTYKHCGSGNKILWLSKITVLLVCKSE